MSTFYSDLIDFKDGFDALSLSELIESTQNAVRSKISAIKSNRSAISIADMFDMQVLMNRLAQFSEMSTSILAAANTSIQSLSRNVKG